KLGIKLLVGTDTGNNSFTPYGQLHAKELEIFVKHGGYTPMEAIVAATRDNAYAVGLEGQVGELAPGKLADIIVLDKDPIADITVLQGGQAPRVGDQGRQDRRPRLARRDAHVPAGGGIASGGTPGSTVDWPRRQFVRPLGTTRPASRSRTLPGADRPMQK